MSPRLAAIGALCAAGLVGGCSPPPAPPAAPAPVVAPPPASEPEGLVLVEAEALERLTDAASDELLPAPAPDGATILFHAERRAAPGGPELVEQHVLSLALGPPPGATHLSPAERFAYGPAWLPGGGVVYLANVTGPIALVRAPSASPGAPLSIVVEGGRLTEPEAPVASPDGALVALTVRTDEGGHAVALVSVADGGVAILGEGRAPAFAPDGARIAFVRTDGGDARIFVSAAAPGAEARPVTGPGYDCDHPSFSPDGSALVFASNFGFRERKSPRAETLHLFVIPIEGGEPVRLTRGTARAATPRWSSDGWIYFSTDERGSFDLARLRARAPSG